MSPSVSGDRGVAFTPMSAAGRKRVKLIGMLVGVLLVLVIAGVAAIKVANTKRHDFQSFMETFIAAATRIADGVDLDEFVEPASPPPAE